MRSRPLLGALSAFGLLAALTAAVLRVPAVAGADRAVSAAARRAGLAHPGWVDAARLVTHAGDGPVLFAAGVLAVAVLAWQRRWPAVVLVVAAGGATHLALVGLRVAVGRPRPVDGFAFVDLPSYPSGHAVHSGTGALLLVLLLGPRLATRGRRWPVVAVAVVWSVVVGASRVALRVHWPTDVLAGWLLVAGVVLLVLATLGPAGGRGQTVAERRDATMST